jgi:pimeloyl-ACP methyl ester carboxylesterase
MGGLLVQKLVESGDCRAAVLVASAPPAMLTAQPRSLPYLLPMFPRILAGLPVKPPATALRALVLHKLAEVDRRAFTRSFVTESGLVYREMIFGRIRVAVGGRTCPVLCIAGTDDRIVSLRLARATARRWCAPLREYPGRGHWLLAEPRWEEVAGEVVAWLKSQDILPGEQRPAR